MLQDKMQIAPNKADLRNKEKHTRIKLIESMVQLQLRIGHVVSSSERNNLLRHLKTQKFYNARNRNDR